jgi:hypothetical protein
MKYKVSELEGALPDAAVAKALRLAGRIVEQSETLCVIPEEGEFRLHENTHFENWRPWSPSRNWLVGGPIIERNDWLLPRHTQGHRAHLGKYTSQTPSGFEFSGKTPLIAAMRAYVASKFGEEVEL